MFPAQSWWLIRGGSCGKQPLVMSACLCHIIPLTLRWERVRESEISLLDAPGTVSVSNLSRTVFYLATLEAFIIVTLIWKLGWELCTENAQLNGFSLADRGTVALKKDMDTGMHSHTHTHTHARTHTHTHTPHPHRVSALTLVWSVVLSP